MVQSQRPSLPQMSIVTCRQFPTCVDATDGTCIILERSMGPANRDLHIVRPIMVATCSMLKHPMWWQSLLLQARPIGRYGTCSHTQSTRSDLHTSSNASCMSLPSLLPGQSPSFTSSSPCSSSSATNFPTDSCSATLPTLFASSHNVSDYSSVPSTASQVGIVSRSYSPAKDMQH